MDKVAVVILNWNGLSFLEKFLPGVVKHSADQASVYVIDNASTDDSVGWIKENFSNVSVVVNDDNCGFAGGYNEGLTHIEAEYYVLLNSDVEVTANWISPILAYMEEADLTVCQPKILSYSDKTKFEHAGATGGFIDKHAFPFCRGRILWKYEADNGQYDENSEVFWATGAAFFVKAKAYQDVGGLDADFFAHMEEIDLCWRLKNRGHKIGYCSESTVYHVGGGTLSSQSPFKTFLNFRNNLMMLTKNHRGSSTFTRVLARLIIDGIAAARFLSEGKFRSIYAVLRAHISFYLSLASVLRKRKTETSQLNSPNLKGYYKRSIVHSFLLRGLKNFNQLDDQDFV